VLAKQAFHSGFGCLDDRAGSLRSELRCPVQGSCDAFKGGTYDFGGLVGFHSPADQFTDDMAASDHREHGLAAYPQGQVTRASELHRGGSVVDRSQAECPRAMHEGVVSQVCVGVSDRDGKRDHCAETAELIGLIARVRGKYSGEPLVGDTSVRILVLRGS